MDILNLSLFCFLLATVVIITLLITIFLPAQVTVIQLPLKMRQVIFHHKARRFLQPRLAAQRVAAAVPMLTAVSVLALAQLFVTRRANCSRRIRESMSARLVVAWERPNHSSAPFKIAARQDKSVDLTKRVVAHSSVWRGRQPTVRSAVPSPRPACAAM